MSVSVLTILVRQHNIIYIVSKPTLEKLIFFTLFLQYDAAILFGILTVEERYDQRMIECLPCYVYCPYI